MDWDSKLSLSAIIFCLILGLGHSFYRAFDIQSLVSYNQLRMYHTLYPARLDKSVRTPRKFGRPELLGNYRKFICEDLFPDYPRNS